jgi:hypothetical protein
VLEKMDGRAAHSASLTLAVLVLVAAALRLPGLFTDFWLDEIWTLKITLGMDSAWDVFTEVRHSNNHHLNTLIFYALGDLEHWSLYRIHSLLAGVASVALAFRIGERRGRTEAVVAGVLCATSYLLIHFSSEARGYALVVFFGLASFWLLEGLPGRRQPLEGRRQPLEKSRDWRRVALFWICACLGFLSHLMYLHVFAAAVVWMTLRLWRAGGLLPGLARLFAVPTLFLLFVYWFDVRLTKIGDGPDLEVMEILLRAGSYAIGGPPSGLLATSVALATLVLFGGAVVWWARENRDEWLFLAIVIFVSPAMTFLVMRPEVFFVRYFLFSTVFGLIGVAGPLARGLGRAGVPRIVAGVMIATMLVGNGLNVARFYQRGRGSYLETVRLIAESAGSRLPTVGSDHRFRNHNVIRFYNRYVPVDRRLVYQEQDEYPDWWLAHRIGELGDVAQTRAADGRTYELMRVAPYADLSGWHWLVYRRVD